MLPIRRAKRRSKMSNELKRCPFCGGEAEMREGSSTKPYIRCKRCGCRTGSSRYRGNLAKAWNARADATDEQFAMAVHEWALARMEGCDEPEWSMYSGIVDAIGRHRAASAKVVG